MNERQVKILHRIYGVLLSISAVVAGICLIAACVNLYLSGDAPFTRASVAAGFAAIAAPIYECLVLTLGGFFLQLFLPLQPEKLPVKKQWSVILKRRRSAVDLQRCDSALCAQVAAQVRAREKMAISCGLIVVLAGVIFLSYALDSSNFHQTDINGSMLAAMKVMLPCLAAPFGYGLYCCRFFRLSMQREAEALAAAPAEAKRDAAPAQQDNRAWLTAVQLTLLCVAVIMVVYGMAAKGMADVLTKAVNICTECIGLG